jgi:integrase/recombinase XerD
MQGEITGFLDYLTVSKGCSSHTVAAYRNDLGQFRSFVEKERPPERETGQWQELQPFRIQAYLAHLQQQTYASSTIARKVAAVKSFLCYLCDKGEITQVPVSELKPPKVQKNPPLTIAPGAVERLLAEPGKSSHPKALRDKALLEILYTTGMRVSELVGLDVDDVDVTSGTITCGTGSKRSRVVPVHKETALALKRYLAVGREALSGENEDCALFLNHRGSRLTRQGLWLIIREYVEAVGITEPVTPHTLRHSFAIHLLNTGANLHEVQKRLGHASASTTLVYRRVSNESANGLTIDGLSVTLQPEPTGVQDWQAALVSQANS